MQSQNSKRTPIRWAAALVLVAAGFAMGLTIAGLGGSERAATPIQAAFSTPEAVAQTTAMQTHSYADVAARAMPAVVNISSDKVVDSNWQHPFMDDPFFRRFFGQPQENQRRRPETSLGSGIVISSDGYILTNSHVVEKAEKIRVSFAGEEEYEAEIVGADPQTDVALIKIDADNLPTVDFARSADLRIGDQVMAIGNPFGLGQTVTLGIVSAIGRSIGLIDYEDLIQTDATINPGNSGGALVNMRGEVVGMNAAILSRSGGSQGIGFAIPSDMAQRVMQSLRDHGEVERAWLGVGIQAVDQSMADYYGLDKPRGVLISSVNEDTPAEKAGLREGDIITEVDGEAVNTTSRLRNKISLSPVGEPVELRLLRDGKNKTVKVKLAKLPPQDRLAQRDSEDGESDDGIEGVTVRELTDQRRRMTSIPDDIAGVIVVDVEPISNAAREGLATGDVIMEIGKEDVDKLDDYRRLSAEGTDKPILLRVYKPGTGRIFMAIPR